MEVSLYTNPRIPRVRVFSPNTRVIIKTTNRVSCRVKEATISTQGKKVNFYDVLSLGSKNVGLDEIRKAYRLMALQFHPDVCPPTVKEESTRRFVELQKAYETLSDPVSREWHDYELGLIESVRFPGRGAINHRVGNRRCSREVWEDQLSQLRQRSLLRMQRKNNNKH
ncbi:hypothetical protein CRG98_020874 [Punica granatum]|nr:hypothetical protein CRG98_020874 [Punica granatum]